MAFDFGAFISGLEKKARRGLPPATRRAYAPALNPGTIFSSAKPPVTVPGAILGLTGKLAERVMLPLAIYEQGRQVINPQDNILTRIGDLGSGIRNLASGKDYLEGRTTPLQRAQVGQPMILGGRLGYKAADGTWQPRGDMESENIPQYLPGSPQADKSGYVWDAARQPASGNQPPGTTPPAAPRISPEEQAYNAERSRIAQLTAQNPEFQNVGQLRNDLRDKGMEIWAAKYGNLAKQVKPGQSGYEAIQGTLAGNMARAGQGFGMAEQLVPTPQGFPTQVPGLPTGAGYSTGFGVTSNLAPGAQTPPPYSTIRPTSELSGLGAAPLGTAQTSVFGQPNVMDAAKFEELLKLVKK